MYLIVRQQLANEARNRIN